MKRWIAYILTPWMIYAQDLDVRTISRTNDTRNTTTKQLVSWYQGEKVQYDLWIRAGTNAMYVPGTATPIWYATDTTLTNYYLFLTGTVVSAAGGQVRFVLPSTLSGLAASTYESAVVIYDGSPTGQPPRLVGDRIQARVQWSPNYSGLYVGPFPRGTNYYIDENTIVLPNFWSQYEPDILAQLNLDTGTISAIQANNVLTSNSLLTAVGLVSSNNAGLGVSVSNWQVVAQGNLSFVSNRVDINSGAISTAQTDIVRAQLTGTVAYAYAISVSNSLGASVAAAQAAADTAQATGVAAFVYAGSASATGIAAYALAGVASNLARQADTTGAVAYVAAIKADTTGQVAYALAATASNLARIALGHSQTNATSLASLSASFGTTEQEVNLYQEVMPIINVGGGLFPVTNLVRWGNVTLWDVDDNIYAGTTGTIVRYIASDSEYDTGSPIWAAGRVGDVLREEGQFTTTNATFLGTVSSAGLTVSGAVAITHGASVASNLSVGGSVTLSNLTIAGTVSAASNVTIAGTLSVTNLVISSGKVSFNEPYDSAFGYSNGVTTIAMLYIGDDTPGGVADRLKFAEGYLYAVSDNYGSEKRVAFAEEISDSTLGGLPASSYLTLVAFQSTQTNYARFLSSAVAPATPTNTGANGEIRVDATNLYLYVARSNRWLRIPGSFSW